MARAAESRPIAGAAPGQRARTSSVATAASACAAPSTRPAAASPRSAISSIARWPSSTAALEAAPRATVAAGARARAVKVGAGCAGPGAPTSARTFHCPSSWRIQTDANCPWPRAVSCGEARSVYGPVVKARSPEAEAAPQAGAQVSCAAVGGITA
jgi:hypothetical protein